MPLPLRPPLAPMLARSADSVPTEPSGSWLYEPKWDGFRAIVWRDGDATEITSRGTRGLARYFPELVDAFSRLLPPGCIVDGEIAVADDHGLNFDLLGHRIHPADSRVRRLASETPAIFFAFDLLAHSDADITDRPFAQRRALLEDLLGSSEPPLYLTPTTTDAAIANDWFARFEGVGLDGVVAKPIDAAYQPGMRALVKVKHQRSADCVVAGYRLHKDGESVGSLLLGLFDGAGVLHSVGVTSGFTAKRRRELVGELDGLTADPGYPHPWLGEPTDKQLAAGQRRPGGESRWTGGRDASWVPLRIENVAEVSFSQIQGDPAGRWGPSARFRHPATFQRWRPDRDADSCTYSQLQALAPAELTDLLSS